MEALFVYRQVVGFRGEYAEPAIGWIGEASQGLLQLGKQLEQDADLLLPAPPVWMDSKRVDKQTVAELAGHGDTGFLKRIYCHPQMQLKQRAANQFTQNVFFGGSCANAATV